MNDELHELATYPWAFWIVAAVWLVLVGEAIVRWQEAWTKPALIIYFTIAAWYPGDLLYIGIEHFGSVFPERILSEALWQVVLFLLSYRWLTGWLVPKFLRGLPRAVGPARIDPRAVPRFFQVCFFLWLGLFVAGATLSGWDLVGLLWPPAAPNPVTLFSRPGVGSGLDFLLSTAGNVYMLVCSSFGVFLVICRGPLRLYAALLILVSWPNIWFGPYRNTMLALFLPGVLTYWLFGRAPWQLKTVVTLLLFLFVHYWFIGVEQYRGGEESLGARMDLARASTVVTRHAGLDMLEELCFMDSFVNLGLYHPNWGERYFAEIANVVPRTFWPGKPMPGIDYALARGFGGNADSQAGVYATISTGMIGQGVSNFGPFFGVVAAALLMTCWTGILARLWLQRARVPRLFLFIIGCGLTFNLGRDITLLVLWPFCFGMVGVWIGERYHPYLPPAAPAPPSPPPERGRSARPRLRTNWSRS
jgi:hypothetical protein